MSFFFSYTNNNDEEKHLSLYFLFSSVTIIKNHLFFYTNHKSQNKKFPWLDKTFVSYYFVSFMTLKTKTKSFYPLIRHLFLAILLCLCFQKQKRHIFMTY